MGRRSKCGFFEMCNGLGIEENLEISVYTKLGTQNGDLRIMVLDFIYSSGSGD